MLKRADNTAHQTVSVSPGFQSINRGYNSAFRPNHLSLGLVVPLETYSQDPVPTMTRHLERVQMAEQLGFAAVWLRDVPFNVPSFGDAGQMYDPFVYLGLLAGQTNRIALAVASIVLPLRHPATGGRASKQRAARQNPRYSRFMSTWSMTLTHRPSLSTWDFDGVQSSFARI